MAHVASRVAKTLEGEGYSAEVIDLCSVVPLDRKTVIDSVRKTKRLVVIDEDYKTCGVAGEVIASVVEEIGTELLAPPQRVAFLDTPIPFARPLEQFARPDEDKLLKAAMRTLKHA